MAQLSSHRGTLDHIPAPIRSVDGVQPVRKTENLNICKQLAGVCVFVPFAGKENTRCRALLLSTLCNTACNIFPCGSPDGSKTVCYQHHLMMGGCCPFLLTLGVPTVDANRKSLPFLPSFEAVVHLQKAAQRLRSTAVESTDSRTVLWLLLLLPAGVVG